MSREKKSIGVLGLKKFIKQIPCLPNILFAAFVAKDGE